MNKTFEHLEVNNIKKESVKLLTEAIKQGNKYGIIATHHYSAYEETVFTPMGEYKDKFPAKTERFICEFFETYDEAQKTAKGSYPRSKPSGIVYLVNNPLIVDLVKSLEILQNND